MPFNIGSVGQTAAQGAIGAGLGLLLEKHNDKRQLKQQRKLMEMEMEGQRSMGMFNYDQQMKLWEATNAKAQMEQIKKAGLNPALMYGTSGPGGTTATINGNVSGGEAPKGGGEAIGMGIQMMNMQLMDAQRKVLESQANLNNVNANKTGGVDTEEAQSRIAQIASTIKNQEAQNELMQIDKELKGVELDIKGRTIEDQIDIITSTASSAITDAVRLRRRNSIEEVTLNDTVQQIKAESIGALLHNAQTRAGTTLTKAQTATEQEKPFLTREQANAIGREIERENTRLILEGKRITNEEIKAMGSKSGTELGGELINAIQTIMLIRAAAKPGGPKEIEGFKTGKNK